jgi:hypothetical protein
MVEKQSDDANSRAQVDGQLRASAVICEVGQQDRVHVHPVAAGRLHEAKGATEQGVVGEGSRDHARSV